MGCSTAAKWFWWPSRAVRTPWPCSTSSRSWLPGSTCGWPSATCITASGPRRKRDADLARAHAERLGLAYFLERVSVRRAPPWEGLEAEARRVRLAALEARAHAIGADRIATGHTADDQAETVLMRLFDGAGPRGLSGIAFSRGRLIRPLLASRRADVLAHLTGRGLDWVEDASNRDPSIRRNRIRHEVLPYLAQVCGPAITESLCRSAALSRALVDDLEQRARAELTRLATRGPSGIVFKVADLRGLSTEMAPEVLLQAAAVLGDARPRRGVVHRAVRRFVSAETTRRAVKMGPLVMERSGRWLRVGPLALPALGPRHWDAQGSLVLDELGLRLEARRFDRPDDYAPPRARDRVAFDADGLPETFIVRPRRRGERFAPFGGPEERRLKSLLSDAGIPRWERSRIPLLGGRWPYCVGRGTAARAHGEHRAAHEAYPGSDSPSPLAVAESAS